MDNNNITYNNLLKSIEHWNEYRVPILGISKPDKYLNFQGAMRFYFQDAGQKVATKCVNVTSSHTTKDVIDVLIEKFRPDMRMLSVPEYGLYEIHENGDERKLGPEERPLYVQLEWNKDDREGRFLLRRMDEKTRDLASQKEERSLLSKKDKKKQEKIKRQQQKEQEKANAAVNKLAAKNKNGIAERLYNELPETSFTRSISNPEAVMKRRRAQKLEKRLQEFSIEGGQDAGGTLRIFGETIDKDVSYKTLLLSTKDTAFDVVKQILEKYGKDNEDPSNYCLVKLIVPHSATSVGGDNNSVHDLNTSSALRESILEDYDCPLLINQSHDKSKGILTFHIRHKPADYQKRRKKKPPKAQVQQNPLHPLVVQQLNQRLQMNNNSEQYSNQNSPQNSSHTSSSINHDAHNPPPPTFETVHSMPTILPSSNGMYPNNGMFPTTNGNLMPYPPPPLMHQNHQQHSVSAATLPPRINSYTNNIHPDVNGTLQRLNYTQPNHIQMTNINNNNSNTIINNSTNNTNYNGNNKSFTQNHMIPNNNLLMGQPPIQQYVSASGANDHILPALIQVKEDVEINFLNCVITQINPSDISFKLAPTYVLYMVSRYRASTLFHPELQAPSRAELFVPFTKRIASMIRNTIQVHVNEPTFLAFWLANSSDLSHFYKQDKHLSHFTIEAQEILYDSIKASFKYLLACKQHELDSVLNSFFNDIDDPEIGSEDELSPDSTSIYQVVYVLNETMATLRKNRVNAALTIQIFSHLFHHISKWLFDRLIGVYDQPNTTVPIQPNFAMFCNSHWGQRLTQRLFVIETWAEKQGLEQAAEFHLVRVVQVCSFLGRAYPTRITPNEFKLACDACDRLNPVQLRALLQRYQPDFPILRAIIENLLYTMGYSYVAGNYPLEEDPELKIPFLIPEDGYSSEMIRYIPNGLLEFVRYLSKLRVGDPDRELCIFTVQPTSSGFWTVYFKNYQSDTPDIIVIQLRKKNNSMGLSIIAARGLGQERLGIYIKNVVKNGAAAMDGRLQAGDQLLEVDGNSLIDITQETAAELMQRTGPVVTLKIAKQAAIYHNLSDVINSPPAQTIVTQQAEKLKKVSWVDTQPHQSLHTLIPPSPASIPSPPAQEASPITENQSYRDNNNYDEDEDEREHDDDDGDEDQAPISIPPPPLPVLETPPNSQIQSKMQSQTQEQTQTKTAALAQQPPSPPPESLTLEDIDEVLSSKTHNNWLEDSAGVIGTQEVYNDPRQRIVKQRELPKDNVNIEELSFQEKLKMFNISSKN